MNTALFQQNMADVINGQQNPFKEHELTGPASSEQLLQVYKNNYRISLSEYLGAVFPVCLALVGEDFFAQLANAYIDEYPPQAPQLDGYGEMLPSFIRSYEFAASVPYLSDVCQLEWQLDRLGNSRFHANNGFPFGRLQSTGADAQTSIIFELNKNIAWQTFKYPALSIWKGVTNGNLNDIDMDSAESVIFQMEPDHSIAMELVSPQGIALLGAFFLQKTIAEIMDSPASAEGVGLYLESWIQASILINFHLSDKE